VIGALVMTGAGLVAAPGAIDVGDTEAAEVVFTLFATLLSVEARTGGAPTFVASMLTGAALPKTTGSAVPADTAGTLGGNRSAGASAGRSARPIAKQPANTATLTSSKTSAIRT
jgi:hypothetical protein